MVAFEEYKKLKPRSGPGQADDVDELYTAAKSKKAMIEASEAEKASPPPAEDGDEPKNAAAPANTSTKPKSEAPATEETEP